MIRTLTRRLLLALAVAALALPLAAAPPPAEPDAPPSFEPANPLVQLWTAFQELLGLDSDPTTTADPLTEDPQAGPYIDPIGATEEPIGEAGPLIDPFS
jgi:hypothetical protein